MQVFLPAVLGFTLACAALGASQVRMPLSMLAPVILLIPPQPLAMATPQAQSILPQIAFIQQQQTDQDRQVANLLDQIAAR